MTAAAVAAKKASSAKADHEVVGLKGIGFDEQAATTSNSEASSPLVKSGDAVSPSAESVGGDASVNGYCYSCSGGYYGCMDCSGGSYYCCSGMNICCGGVGYCASSCSGGGSSYDDDWNDDDCFHEDTVVLYKGTARTLADFLRGDEPECVIPHVVDAIGVHIETDCGSVGVTPGHLILTPEGYESANSLEVGDVILGEKEDQECKVTGITQHEDTKKYFGLNCLESEVVVDGMRASTFGNYHALPATFMYYAGNAFGISTASKVGDALASVFFTAGRMVNN
jgi:hypothetical protein